MAARKADAGVTATGKPRPTPFLHGKAKGPGIGGPAKGFVYKPVRGAGEAGKKALHARAAAARNAPPDVKAARQAKIAALKADREARLELYLEIATDTEQHGNTRVAALNGYFERVEGKSPQSNINFDGGKKSLEDLIIASRKPKAE